MEIIFNFKLPTRIFFLPFNQLLELSSTKMIKISEINLPVCLYYVFDHLPVDAGFVRTESAGNAGLGVSGLDVTPQVTAKGGFKPTVFTQMSHSLVFHSSVKLQVLFGFGFVITKIAMYLCITVNGDQVGFQQIYSLSRVITLITFVGLAFMSFLDDALSDI